MMPPTKTLLINPTVAWPSIILAMLAIITQVAALSAAIFFDVSLWLCAGGSFISIFIGFTPMHDAAHRAVSRHRLLNDWVGRISSCLFGAPFVAFRYVHLKHHKHTNDPLLDPDFYSGSGRIWTLPIRWMTQDFYYYVAIFRDWSRLPLALGLEALTHLTLICVGIALFVLSGHGEVVLFAWLIPRQFAIGALTFAFNYLPHAPHETMASQDRFRATKNLQAPGLTALLLCQNYHLVHHLFPGIPFYRCRKFFLHGLDRPESRRKSMSQLRSIASWSTDSQVTTVISSTK